MSYYPYASAGSDHLRDRRTGPKLTLLLDVSIDNAPVLGEASVLDDSLSPTRVDVEDWAETGSADGRLFFLMYVGTSVAATRLADSRSVGNVVGDIEYERGRMRGKYE